MRKYLGVNSDRFDSCTLKTNIQMKQHTTEFGMIFFVTIMSPEARNV